jgi:hypothetical protein
VWLIPGFVARVTPEKILIVAKVDWQYNVYLGGHHIEQFAPVPAHFCVTVIGQIILGWMICDVISPIWGYEMFAGIDVVPVKVVGCDKLIVGCPG